MTFYRWINQSLERFAPNRRLGVGTGHHRSYAGINRILSAFLSPPGVARPLVAADGAQYLAMCRKELEPLAAARPGGVASHLLREALIDWLQPEPHVSYGGFRVYRIVRPKDEDTASWRNMRRH